MRQNYFIKSLRPLATLGLAILLVGGFNALSYAGANVERVTIADYKGDWGFPSPYRQYMRGPGYIRVQLVFDTLVWKGKEGVLLPALAKKWDYIEKENAYVFELRDDVKWHDGGKFTPKDVIFTIKYNKKHPYKWAPTKIVSKVEQIGDNKIKMTLKEPYAPFLASVAVTLPILPEHIYKDIAEPKKFKEAKAAIGTGPFKLIKYDKKQGSYLFEAFNEYYLGKPKVGKLSFVKVNKMIAAGALQKGEVDATPISGDVADKLKEAGFTVISKNSGHPTKLVFNHNKAPFDQKAFRKAIAYGIDRDELVKVAQRGHAAKGNPGYFQLGQWKNNSVEQYNYNPNRSRAILERLGYKKDGAYYTKDHHVLYFEVITSKRFQRAAELVVRQLEKIGIKVNLRVMETQTLDARVNNQKFDMALIHHGTIGDPRSFNAHVIKKSHTSDRFFKNKELVRLLKEQVAVLDPKKRKALLDKAQEIYADEVPSLFLYSAIWYWAFNDKLDLWFTPEGVASRIPLPLNKSCFVQ